MKQKYLFLYLKTGGGHLAPARAVASFLLNHHADEVEPVLVDGFTEAPQFVRAAVEDGYRTLQSRAQWLYSVIYLFNKIPFIGWLNSWLVGYFVSPYLERIILEVKPEKIVIFHFLLIEAVSKIVERNALQIPVVNVVTDPYTAHPLWFRHKEQHYVVFSDRLKQDCVERNICPSRVNVFPFILEEKYSVPFSEHEKIAFKLKLGIDPDREMILVMGGGDGIPKGKSILRSLATARPQAEIILVCGNNTALFEAVLAWVNKHANRRVKVIGFTDSAYELINTADLVVTKCGASMFMQSLMAGKAPLIVDYLWGQEKGNVEFLMANEMGVYEKSVRNLPEKLRLLSPHFGEGTRYRENIARAALRNGTDQVSRFLLEFRAA
jgi:processive 1,2-diacylglycerol beta-glucosyltransferase/1,2-diacylglycerol 3-beta-galactosyltransferase